MHVEFPIFHIWKYGYIYIVEWIPWLLFFQEKQHFTLTSNDTNSCDFVLVNHEFHLDLQGNRSQTLMCFRITWTVLWNENISYHVNKQATSQPGVISGLNTNSQTSISGRYHPPWWLPRGAGGMQEASWMRRQDWPQTAEMHKKGMNAVNRGLHLSIQRMLNSLIPDRQVQFRLPAPFVANLSIASLEQFPQSYWDAVSGAQES